MKSLFVFLFGMIVGVILTSMFWNNIYSSTNYEYNPYGIRGLKILEQEGKCITRNNLEVFQSLTDGVALAYPVGDYRTIVLLIDNSNRLFYDGEKIKNPKDYCAKQIGVYTYETKAEIQKTVPAVIIEKIK